MDKKLILNKLQTLYKEYLQYKEYFEDFMEDVDKQKSEIAKKIASDDFEEELEEFVLEAFVLRHIYASDLDILVDKMITYTNAARLLGFEEHVEEEIRSLISKNKDKEIRPRFIIEQGKPMEVMDGFVEEQRKSIKEQGNIKKLIEKINK